ncbi:double-strand break repair protein AddB [Aestuariivirga litoralis]|uniref:double-strand break repair protein AddB n=1 Tax=Aestuariivirga litoralis TaxID=2650924 RepID=UPI0018C628EB|nr:double-strand break repair protein AddB [Aestuariivirga litoralis]MBG1233931.1 double-strand break repair protein AddB [Aestuariivirga litoralis]
MATLPRVFTIAAGANFLEILAEQVLAGFPLENSTLPPSDWTILLPTRRAVSTFKNILRQKSGKKALVLPRIQPIGDLDEDRLEDGMVSAGLPNALSSIAVTLELSRLARQWADEHPEIELAQEIAAAPAQCLGLARSLADFVTTVETQDGDLSKLPDLYNIEEAEHREAIISLLELLSVELPKLHARDGTMGAAARRSKMLRLEAARIASGQHKGPIIAAGSTGTIPATRDLLAAISRHPEGALVLPGLDLLADDASWANLPQEHAQFALKQLLDQLEIRRADVQPLGPNAKRNLLASEMMRPTATAALWHETLPAQTKALTAATQDLCEIAAANRHEEARSIALIMREVLEHKNKRAILVTPDRDLATRVTQELKRWNISIADSYGRPLSQAGLGLALDLLLQALLGQFEGEDILAFLRHPSVTLGMEQSHYQPLLRQFELAVLRGRLVDGQGFAANAKQAQIQHARDTHPHPLLKGMSDETWQQLQTLAEKIDAVAALRDAKPQPLGEQLKKITSALEQAITPELWQAEDNAPLLDFFEQLQSESWRRSALSINEAALILRDLLRQETARTTSQDHPRLSILGTLEARLIPTDVMILGGLNEGVWPPQSDPGPWLNRNMRKILNFPQPERDIGLAAHDFEQGFSHPKCVLTWSKRLSNAPASPSRWLLRLDAVLAVAKVKRDHTEAAQWLGLAQSLEQPDGTEPLQGPIIKPAFNPPVATRPKRFSATEIERLIRNPYAIYARRILKLEPVPDFISAPSPALRGTIFHDAIGAWNQAQASGVELLLQEGEKQFAAYGLDAALKSFWEPHFRRVAAFLVKEEEELKHGLAKIHAELNGRMDFDVDGEAHILTARADRIDVLANGEARIIDYKTGEPPSPKQVDAGLNPQMTLQAAILLDSGFKPMNPKGVREALYVKIGRGRDGMWKESAVTKDGPGIEALAQNHLAGLKTLLGFYLQESLPYLPRLRSEKDDADEDYDHLSRYLEWQLAGEAQKE